MKICCVAVVGATNNPLYLKTFEQPADVLKFHFIVHTSLDVVEERASSSAAKKSLDLYLGFLCPYEDYKVYGYVTNTKNKLIIVVDDYDLKDFDVKNFFKSFHAIFADAVCNPFYTPNEKITGKRFDLSIQKLVSRASQKKPQEVTAV